MAKREETTEKKNVSFEEIERERKRNTKERLNTFLRVVGLVTTIMLIVVGLFDVLFELSYFGAIADKFSGGSEHNAAWSYLSSHSEIGCIFDDGMAIGIWFPKLVLSLVLAAGVIGVIYLITFSLVDFVEFIKNLIKIGREVTVDNAENVRSLLPRFGNKKPKETEKDQGIFESTPKKKTTKKPKDTEKNEYGYTNAELDALLRGEDIEIQKTPEEDTQE